MYKKRKTICRVLAMALIFPMLGQHMPVYAQETSTEQQYVIIAETEADYDDIVEDIGEDILEAPEELAENNIIVAELTEKEAKALAAVDDVLIEEDIIISAFSAEAVSPPFSAATAAA